MKFIFWTNIYDEGLRYLENNTSIQNLSKKHELYLMANGKKCVDMAKSLYQGEIIESINDKAVKGKLLFDVLKSRTDYDVLVRLDLDAVVIDSNKLINLIEPKIENQHAVVGHIKTFKGRKEWNKRFSGISYVRGPCNATSKSVIDQIEMDISFPNAGFDIPYAISFKKTGCKFVKCALYEDRESYKGILPVWHWHQKGDVKYQAFMKVINKHE